MNNALAQYWILKKKVFSLELKDQTWRQFLLSISLFIVPFSCPGRAFWFWSSHIIYHHPLSKKQPSPAPCHHSMPLTIIALSQPHRRLLRASVLSDVLIPWSCRLLCLLLAMLSDSSELHPPLQTRCFYTWPPFGLGKTNWDERECSCFEAGVGAACWTLVQTKQAKLRALKIWWPLSACWIRLFVRWKQQTKKEQDFIVVSTKMLH